jgi:signal transduction histidine kinase
VLALTSDGESLMAGGAAGLVVYKKGKFTSVLNEDGSALGGISGVVRTHSGEIWLNTTTGVVRIPSSEAAKLTSENSPVRVAVERYVGEDGIDGTPTTVRPLPTAALSNDGRVFISTTKGIFQIDPQDIQRNPIAPRVVVAGLVSDGIEYDGESRKLLPPGATIIEIAYTAASLTSPQRVRFRYKLQGFDSAWRIPSDHRNATYTNLAPGSYRFAVQAANEDGVWGAINEGLSFAIEPHFWQTGWFRTLCVAAIVCLLWILYAAHLRRIAERLKIKIEARSEERERIARELHDTLLQGTLGLVLNFQIVANKMPKDDPQRTRINTIIDQAERSVEEARERVLKLRTSSVGGGSLEDALHKAGHELAQHSNIEFSFLRAGRSWSPDDEANFELILIGREAMLNAFHHSHGTKIETALFTDDEKLVLTVRDDGIGFDGELSALRLKEGHVGLIGMRERARRLGATLSIASARGKGTEIRLTLPRPAYAKVAPRLQMLRNQLRRFRVWR